MFIAILTILIGAVLTAGGAQELIVGGIFNNMSYALLGGALGIVAGALLLSAGVALLRESPRAIALIRASALVCALVFVVIGFLWPLAGWPARIIGVAFPLFLLGYFRKSSAYARYTESADQKNSVGARIPRPYASITDAGGGNPPLPYCRIDIVTAFLALLAFFAFTSLNPLLH
jgi:hypothetical protein